MMASLPEENIDKFIRVLQKNHSASVELTNDQYLQIANTLEKPTPKKIMALPTQEDNEELLILELEAEALGLELELLQVA